MKLYFWTGLQIGRQSILFLLTLFVALGCSSLNKSTTGVADQSPGNATPAADDDVIRNIRQFTFSGPRAGEGYFSPDEKLLIFQSEREDANPFYQIYVRDLINNNITRVSPGYGKTTCGWIAPDKKSVIFSSTHLDPLALKKQQDELNTRKLGIKKRYSWDFDENYDIFRATLSGTSSGTPHRTLSGHNLQNLTKAKGYDAEGSISPDGKQIVFASNREVYERELSPSEKEIFNRDPSYFLDIYIMNADGSGLRRLTTSPGYDGGPFFSPDGQRIVWRRFSADGRTAEIFTMNTDGLDTKQITHLNAMSWAPFYHPSGDYIIFTSSLLGHHNFELYVVDTEGRNKPVRVTFLDGFDGLPVFTPDGQKLTWSRKLSESDSQIMMADWDDSRIRQKLKLKTAIPNVKNLHPELSQTDLKTIIKYLASKELAGRQTGSNGEAMASEVIANYYHDIGLSPLKDFIQAFPFLKDATLGSQNQLTVLPTQQVLDLNKAWRPVAFSKSGEFSSSPVVFAGYGIRAAAEAGMLPYDSYANLNVKGKWVLVLRYIPENVSAARRLYLQRHAKLEYKASIAKDLGAKGIIFVSGPSSNVKEELLPFKRISGSDIGIVALSLSDDMANQFFSLHQKTLAQVQKDLDLEIPFTGFEFDRIRLAAKIDIRIIPGEGHNTLGLLRVPGAQKTLIIGAHGDHLGDQHSDSSRRTNQDADPIHYGADDNASGVSAVMELAHYFKTLYDEKKINLKQNILFAIWSGEELGTLGSMHFARKITSLDSSAASSFGLQPSAYINMDMIGRWHLNPTAKPLKPLLIQGIGSSPKWRSLIEALNLQIPILLQEDPYLPTDSTSFYLNKIPTANFFTGAHHDYHTPRDTEDKIDYPGLLEITKIISNLATLIATKDESLPYHNVPRANSETGRGFRIYLGTIPDYTQVNIKGVRLSGVITGGPAEKSGLKSGDIIIEFSQKTIENIHDYVFTLETVRANEPTQIVVLRDGKREELTITPIAKE